MIETEEFVQLIVNLQKNKAKAFVKKIYRDNLQKYGDALVTVILVQANRKLQETLRGYYVDEAYVTRNSDRKKVFCTIDSMCDAVKERTKENGERILRKAVSYIENNLSDSSLYAGSVAQFVGVSGSSLSKLFEKELGVTPVRYIAENRVKKSIAFLTENDASIKAVAEMSGFSSAEAYIRAFKKIYGTTPGKYKEQE